MNSNPSSPLTAFLRLSRPLALLGSLLLYSLGAGLVVYLGGNIRWPVYWLGQASILLLQLSSFYLQAYYDHPDALGRAWRKRISKGEDDHALAERLPRVFWLQAAVTTLTIGAVLTVLLLSSHAINPATLLILGFAFLLSFFYAVPPVRLVYTGYGELANAFLMVNLTPALAFMLQTGEIHRLLAMLTFPLTALYLAMTLALSLSEYSTDMLLTERRNLLIRIGWERGMNLHNLLILFAYLLLGIAALLGLPWALAWPPLLTLPIGLYQIYQISQISAGAKPRWGLLIITAMATLGMTAYLITLALWTA